MADQREMTSPRKAYCRLGAQGRPFWEWDSRTLIVHVNLITSYIRVRTLAAKFISDGYAETHFPPVPVLLRNPTAYHGNNFSAWNPTNNRSIASHRCHRRY